MNMRIMLLFVLTLFAQLINGSGPSSTSMLSKAVAGIPDHEIITLDRNGQYEPTLHELQRAVVFTPSGLTCYFKHIYSCRRYVEDVLPYKPFKHMSEFLEHGIQTKQNRLYTKAVFRLFDKKFKAISIVVAPALQSFLQKLPDLLEKDLGPDVHKKMHIKKLVRTELEQGFDQLKKDPDSFLDQLAEKIVCGNYYADNVSRMQICACVTKFVDLCLSKAMWSVQTDVWGSFTQIGRGLMALHKKGIIPDADALDDCQWTLTTRFVTFLSLWGSDLPLEFYQKAGEEIRKGVDYLDALTEQEVCLKTKIEYLKEALVEGAIKANAHQKGIISEAVLRPRP